MITEQTIREAEEIANELRQRGEVGRAQTIETLVEAARTGNGANGASQAPEPVAEDTEQVGDLFSVSGPTLKKWVEEGRYASYRVGKFSIPRELVEEYVRRSGPSLDLEDFTPEEAARLVAEGRGWA
jgi:excisionase family DNA binding protein